MHPLYEEEEDEDEDEDEDEEEDEDEDDIIIYDIMDYEYIYNNNAGILNNTLYLGLSVYDPIYNVNLLANRISPRTFFRYLYKDTIKYLEDFSIIQDNSTKIKSMDIMLIHVAYNAYTVINKTFWLRLVQRRWRNILKERNRMFRNIHFLRNREIYNKPVIIRGLQGMLYGI
jgi:hypothetical protein